MPEQGEVFSRSSIAEERTADAVAIALASADRRLSETFDRLSFADAEQAKLFDARFKAAEIALTAAKDALDARLQAGDKELLAHIDAQKVSVAAALASLNQILDERKEAALLSEERRRDELSKADKSLSDRLYEGNKIRDQLREQAATLATREALDALRTQLTSLIERNREDIADQRGTHLPMVTFNSTVGEWTGWRQGVDELLTKHQARIVGRDGLDDMLQPMRDKVEALQSWQFKIAGALIFITIVLPGVVAFAVYLLTRHAVPVDNGLAK